MDNDSNKVGRSAAPGQVEGPFIDFEIGSVLLRLRRYQGMIWTITAAAAIVCIIAGLLAYVLMPVERTASIQFRLLFDRAAEGKYPDGTPFSAAEIISTPVLTEVYGNNDLQRFGDFHQFKDAMVVLRSNSEIEMLDEQYSARLADAKLSATERSRVEEEYKKKREAMVDPVYSVSLRRVERLRTMPQDLVQKVLNDTLTTWARQAEAKGAIVYNVSALSRNILQPDVIKDEDYLIAVDVLRVQTRRVLDAITQIQALPGAQTFRTGKEAISLGEITANLQDTLQLQLDPLISLIRSEGLAKDPNVLRVYTDGRLSDLNLDKARAKTVMLAVQNAFQDYTKSVRQDVSSSGGRVSTPSDTTLMPQLSGDFLDKLMELAKPQNTDAAYRQRLSDDIVVQAKALASIDREVSYYESLSAAIKTMRQQTASGIEQKAVADRIQRASDTIGTAIDRVMAIYQGLSTQNLNPSTMLYTVTTPFALHTVASVSLATISALSALIIVLAFIGACVGCLLYDAIAKPQPRAAA